MGRVDSAIAGVQERDKWRRRLEALEAALLDLGDKRRRLELRLRHVHHELTRLERTEREFAEIRAGGRKFEVSLGPTGPILR